MGIQGEAKEQITNPLTLLSGSRVTPELILVRDVPQVGPSGLILKAP